MQTILYLLAIKAYFLGIRIAALFGVRQAKLWVKGRKNAAPYQQLLHLRSRPKKQKLLWMHCASLGEWEQGRPVLTALKQRLPDYQVLLTFFSPSGYERCKNSDAADYVTYLPADGPANAKRWVQTVRPDLAIFVKYEFWYFHLQALRSATTPTFLVAASFRRGQPFFRAWGGWWRRLLRTYTMIIVQTPADQTLLITYGNQEASRVHVAGDPRMDRTQQLAATEFSDPILDAFCAAPDTRTLFAGSVWPQDVSLWEAVWPQLPPQYRLVLAPHQLHEKELVAWAEAFGAIRYTKFSAPLAPDCRVLLLDTIGILSRAYRYGSLAYVGGAFKTGLHNTLEPMAYGLPVLFGPLHEKFPEAAAALQAGGAISVRTPLELQHALQHFDKPSALATAQKAQIQLSQQLAGAGERTARVILPLLP